MENKRISNKKVFIHTFLPSIFFSQHPELLGVLRLKKCQKEKYFWEFLSLGANIVAIATAGRFGISTDWAANYHSDHEGTALNYEVLADTVSDMRNVRSISKRTM